MKQTRNIFLFALVGICSAAYFTGPVEKNAPALIGKDKVIRAGTGIVSAQLIPSEFAGSPQVKQGYNSGKNEGKITRSATGGVFGEGANGVYFNKEATREGFISAASSDDEFTAGDNGISSDRTVVPITALEETIPGGGVPGQHYPILDAVPDTGFTCESRIIGYYADTALEAQCQVFHLCQEEDRHDSFLCPNGTIFNQKYFVCDWWFNVDCASSEQFYELNAEMGVVPKVADEKNEIELGQVGETKFRGNAVHGGSLSDDGIRKFIASVSNVFEAPQKTIGAVFVGQGTNSNVAGSEIIINKFGPSSSGGNTFELSGYGGVNDQAQGQDITSSFYKAPVRGNGSRRETITGASNMVEGTRGSIGTKYNGQGLSPGVIGTQASVTKLTQSLSGEIAVGSSGHTGVGNGALQPDIPSSFYGAPASSGGSENNGGTFASLSNGFAGSGVFVHTEFNDQDVTSKNDESVASETRFGSTDSGQNAFGTIDQGRFDGEAGQLGKPSSFYGAPQKDVGKRNGEVAIDIASNVVLGPRGTTSSVYTDKKIDTNVKGSKITGTRFGQSFAGGFAVGTSENGLAGNGAKHPNIPSSLYEAPVRNGKIGNGGEAIPSASKVNGSFQGTIGNDNVQDLSSNNDESVTRGTRYGTNENGGASFEANTKKSSSGKLGQVPSRLYQTPA